MAFTTALSTFFSLLSIFCGAAALALPVIALVRRNNTRVNVQDWSALLDTSYAILFCAAVLVALSLVLNIAACLRAMKQ